MYFAPKAVTVSEMSRTSSGVPLVKFTIVRPENRGGSFMRVSWTALLSCR